MAQTHLFVMDPLEKLDPDMDTSIRLAFALHKLGSEIFFCTPDQLLIDSSKSKLAKPWGKVQKLTFKNSVETLAAEKKQQELALENFSAIHVRKDPPYDLDYIAMTWILESVSKRTKIFNSAHSLREFNEKLAILRYPEFCDPFLVSADSKAIIEFANSFKHGAMIKPLHLFGGKGIMRYHPRDSKNHHEIISTLEKTRSVYLCQPFNCEIYSGEVRAFAVAGEPLSWCIKKPREGEFMANSNFGSTRHPHTPTDIEQKIVESISKDLQKHGVEVIGFDLIGGKLSEINITSPRVLTAEKDQSAIFAEFAKRVEQMIE